MHAAARLPTAQRPFVANRTRAVHVQAKFSTANVLDSISRVQLKTNVPKVDIGDTVKVGVAVVEGKGKVRTQKLEGVIIADDSSGINKTITFRRMFQGVGVELMMPIHSPVLQSVELIRNGRVRRAKLYFLRERIGKAAKLKEVLTKKPEKTK